MPQKKSKPEHALLPRIPDQFGIPRNRRYFDTSTQLYTLTIDHLRKPIRRRILSGELNFYHLCYDYVHILYQQSYEPFFKRGYSLVIKYQGKGLILVFNQRRMSQDTPRTIIPLRKWFLVEGERKPVIHCPNCDQCILGNNAPHEIQPNGDVNNSVICNRFDPKVGAICTFHEYVRLDGWNGGYVPRKA